MSKFGVLNEYNIMEKSLTLNQMEALHQDMMREIGEDEDALELYEELVQQANRYIVFRASWCIWNREEKTEKDPSRTSCHDSLIVKFNQLAKYLQLIGKEIKWRAELGFAEDDAYNRKRIGDLACYIVFVNSVCAR